MSSILKQLFFFGLILFAKCIFAQAPDLPVIHDSLYSQVLKEGRPLEIVLPANYNTSPAERYDVLYVTDGEWNTKIVSGIRQNLNIQFTPENIIVSIPNVYPNKNNQRGRDFTPTHSDGMPESGGADNFLSFIKTELMPYVNSKYRTNGENTLYGSSLGGIFAMYTFCREPELFQSYLVADPAWWWDNNYIGKLVKENLPKMISLNNTLLVTGREGAPYQYMGISSVDSLLHSPATAGQHWKTMLYNDETHNSMIFRTIYDGLKYTYAGYMKQNIIFHPMNGIVLNGKSLTLHVNNSELRTNMRFTTDGSQPVAGSTKIAGDTLVLTGAAHLQVKSFSNREKYSTTVTGHFTSVKVPLAANARPKNMQPGGLRYAYFEGSWDSLPDFRKLKAVQSGLAGKDFDIKKLPKQNNFGCVLEGQLEIKSEGYYTFGIAVSGGARLFVDNRLLIDYNGIHSSDDFQSGVVPLAKGYYPFRIEYFQKDGLPMLNMGYIIPDSDRPAEIPFEVQYGKN